jgi:U3 small nucleolar RNA-associated protein 20
MNLEALDHWRQLNLAPSFIRFANKADSLSASMPLLLHNWKDVVDMWIEAFEVSDNEDLHPLLEYVYHPFPKMSTEEFILYQLAPKLAHGLQITLSPIYTNILNCLLQLLSRAINSTALIALLETFSTLFKFLLVPLVHIELLEDTWDAVRLMLPKCLPEVQRAMAEVCGSVLRRLKTVSFQVSSRFQHSASNTRCLLHRPQTAVHSIQSWPSKSPQVQEGHAVVLVDAF